MLGCVVKVLILKEVTMTCFNNRLPINIKKVIYETRTVHTLPYQGGAKQAKLAP